MKFFSIGLVLIIVFGYLQGSTIPSKRSVRSLNAKLQTNINGTFIRKNPCNDSENQKTTYKAFHEIDHHCKEADWSDYARKCSFLINSFLQSLKNLVCSDKDEDAHCNFNINTTISHESGESCGQKGINCSLPTITIEATDLEISPKSQCKNFQVVHWDKPIEGNEIKIRVQGKDYHCYPKEQEEEIEYPSSSLNELGDDSFNTAQPTSETLVGAFTEEDLSDKVNQFAPLTETTFSEPLNGYTTNPFTDMMTDLPETYFQPTTPFIQTTDGPKPSTLIEPFPDQEYRAEEHFSTPPSEYDEEITSDSFFPTQDIPNQSLYITINPPLNADSETELPPTFQTDSSMTDEDKVNVDNDSGLLFSEPGPFTTLSPLSETTTSQALLQENVEELPLKFQEKLSSAPAFEYSTEAVENFKYQTSNSNSLNISPNPELTTSSTFEEVTASNDFQQPVTLLPVYTNHLYQSNTERPISESMIKLNFTNQPSFADYDFTPQPTSIFEEAFPSYSPKPLDEKFVTDNQEVASDKHNPYDSETSLDPLLDKTDETTKPSDDLEEQKDLNDPYYDNMETETTSLDPQFFSTSFASTPAPKTSLNQFTDYNENTPSIALEPFSTEYPDNSFSTISDQFLQPQFSKNPQNDQDYESLVSFPTETPINIKEKETSPYFAPELHTAFTYKLPDYNNLSTKDTEENSTTQNDFSTTFYNQDMTTSPSTDMPLTENPFLSSNPLTEETTSNVASIYTTTPESQENSFVSSDQSPEPQLPLGSSKLPMSVTSSPFFSTEFPTFTENFENKEKFKNSAGPSTEYSETDFLTSSESNTLPVILNTQAPAVTDNPVDLFYTPQKNSDLTYYNQSEFATTISPSQSFTATYTPSLPEIPTQVSQNYEYSKNSPQDSSTLEFQEVTQTIVRPENSPTQNTFIENVTPTINQASYLPSSEKQPEFSDYSTVSPFPYQVSDEPSSNSFLNDYDENISETTSSKPFTSVNSLLTDKPKILPEKSLMFTPSEEAVTFDQTPVKQTELESDSYTYPASQKSFEEEKLRSTTEFQDPNTDIFKTKIPNDFSITSDQSLDMKKPSETFSTPVPQYFEYDYTSISPQEQNTNNNGYETSFTPTDTVENHSNIVPNFQSSTESQPQQFFATKEPLIYLGPVINPNIELKFDSLIKSPILPTIDIPKIPLINKFDDISTSAPKDYSEKPSSHELESSSPLTKQKTLELSVQGSVLNKPLIPSFEFSSQLTIGSHPEATNFDNETNSDSCLTPEIQFKPTDETTVTQLPDSKPLTDPQQPAPDSSFLITSTTQPEFQILSNEKLNEDFSETPFSKPLFINDFEPSATFSVPFTTTPQPADYSSDDSKIKTIFPNEDANQFTPDYPEDYETGPTSSQHTKSTTTINYYDSNTVDSQTHQTDSPSFSTSYDPYEASFSVTSKPLEKSSIDPLIASTFPEETNSKTFTPFLNYNEETLNSEPQFRSTQPPKSKSPDQFDDYFQPDSNIFESSVSYNEATSISPNTDLFFEKHNTEFPQTSSMTTVFPDESITNTEFFQKATGVPILNEFSTTKKPYEQDKETELYNDSVSNSAYEEESLFPTSLTPNLSFQPSTIHNYQPIISDYEEINTDSTTVTPREEFKSFDQSSDQTFYPKESAFDLLADETTKTPSFSEPQSNSPFPNEYFSPTSEDSIFKTQTLPPHFTEQNTPQTNSVTFTEEITTENTPPLLKVVKEFHTTPIPNTQDKFNPEDSFVPPLSSEDAFLTKSKEFSNDPFMPIFSSTSPEISPKPLELSTMPFDDKITTEKSMAPIEPDLCEQESGTLVTDGDFSKHSQPVTYEDHFDIQKESPYTEFITTQSPSTSQWNQLPDNDEKFLAASLVLNKPTLFPEPTDFYLDQLPESTIPPQTQLHSTTMESFENEDLHDPKTIIDKTDPTFFSSRKPSLPLTISSQLSNYNKKPPKFDSLDTNLPVSVDYSTESPFPSEEVLTNTYNQSPTTSSGFLQDYNDQLYDRFTNTPQSELNVNKHTLGEHFTSEKPVNSDEKFTTISYPPFTRPQVLDLVSEKPHTAFSIPEIILDEHNPQDLDVPEKLIDDNCESLTTEIPNSTFQNIKTIFQHNSTILSTDGFPTSPTTSLPPPDFPQLTSFSNLNQMEVGTSDSELLTSTAFPPPQSISLTSPEIKIDGQESTISPMPEAFATGSFFSQPDFQQQSTIPDEVSFVDYEINPLVSNYPLELSTVEPQYIDPNAEVSVAQAAASTFQPDSYALVPDQSTPSNKAGENNISSCSRSSEAALQCPFNPILKGNMTAPSYYILVSKLHGTHDSQLSPKEERFKVEKVYLGDGTPLNCTLNTQQTFPNSWYQPIAFSNPRTVMLKTF